MKAWSAPLLVIGAMLLVLLVFRVPLGPGLGEIVGGSLTSPAGLSRTMVKATPLILVGVGIAIAWRAGAFNIGGEGQFLVGALCGGFAAKALMGTTGPLVWVIILAASSLGGAAWALLAGWMQAARGVQLVVSTILLNFVAMRLVEWSVDGGPLQEAKRSIPLSDRLPSESMVWRFWPQYDVHFGIVLALILAFAAQFFLFRTKTGFRMRVAGSSPGTARANRISVNASLLQAMAISGALCGLAGGIEFAAVSGVLSGQGFAQGWGFLGIPVALLGGLQPLGAAMAGLGFGALFAGTENLGRFTQGGDRLLFVVQGIAVLAYAATQMRRPAQAQEAT